MENTNMGGNFLSFEISKADNASATQKNWFLYQIS
jgi:hypothetical protein